MYSKVWIRKYLPEDKELLVELLTLHVPDFFAESEIADYENYLQHKTELYFVAESDNDIVGAGGINFDKENRTAKISWDFTAPHYQNKGVGRKLLEYRLAILRNMPDVDRITVRTSQLAFRFYEKSGFRLKTVEKDYWAKGFDLYDMELE